ncbi:NADP-dependent malic enzyme [Caldithrix abyssi]|uniref:Allosteric NADP-dependent malic enzyme n=1 Tax=Caldithrix abyssi DSM 13497 TaxID=880073 RepID=H1XW98_CALAY|nr:NADP-dependent malic enzyme [Caldithrix abyssi]APF19062.1 allosteric NADP-dependent malic enzyme [Caldithrix abyssi DSM 13497]EHO43003.1 malic protein NAD-binding [Caldithrix abyssi DSM 13497]
MIRKEDALAYHSEGRKGKIEVINTKPCLTQRDLSLAYTPGVAEPCREIEKNPDLVYEYTAKGNLVAVVSNGTAVLGLGDIGPMAGKPVMEGKGVLFKRFADIDVFDIEIDSKDPEEIVRTVKLLEPTFGGINLEDIKAPECFYIEEKLMEIMDIPVFHDDQHGTAIISAAALLNALYLQGKKIEEVKVVFSGAGAAGIACATLYCELGVKKENLYLVDSKGLVYKGRKEGMNPYKERFANGDSPATLAEVMKDADVFAGVSVAGLVTKEMVKSMADKPIIMAMANPDPEIRYEDAIAVRSDLIMATGRSDYPNQVNNVLGFPFIFRGALDVHARKINMEMKKAAVHALAELARQDVPDSVIRAYGGKPFHFGPEYIIPKPFDPRVLTWEALAVAKAAVESGVARKKITDWDAYRDSLESRLGRTHEVSRILINKAKDIKKRIVLPEGEEIKVLRAAQILIDEEIVSPILLGNKEQILKMAKEHDLDISRAEIVEYASCQKIDAYVDELYRLRQRKGLTRNACRRLLTTDPNYFGVMMVRMGDADGMVSGVNHYYPEVIRPALQILEVQKDKKFIAGLYAMVLKKETIFFADTTVNIESTAEILANTAIMVADKVKKTFDIEPRIAMLSFSNFGSVRHPYAEKVAKATQMVKQMRPDLIIDGEMQVDLAFDTELRDRDYSFSDLKGRANVLIFPSLEAGNIAYKLMMRLGGAEAIGPILVGLEKSVHVLQRNCDVDTIVRMCAIAAVDA